jgi:N-carbamoyl-L-amino-acid hydrolase
MIAGACTLSLDIRAAVDAVRQAAVDDILEGIAAICARRQIDYQLELLLLSAPAAPCAPWLMSQLAQAVASVGTTPYALLSGAGHDAMAMAAITDVAMLFTRCGNGGISHNPLETMTADDADIAAQALLAFLRHFQPKPALA